MADKKRSVNSLADQHSEAEWSVAGTAADNAAATAEKAAETNVEHFITQIMASFSAAVAGALLEVKDGSGGTVLWRGYVHNEKVIPFDKPLPCGVGKAARVELAASGTGGVTGAVSIAGHSLA